MRALPGIDRVCRVLLLTRQCQLFLCCQFVFLLRRIVTTICLDYFLEAREFSGNREKCRQSAAQGVGDDQFGWRHGLVHGA